MDKSRGGNAYSLPGTPGEGGEEWESHSAPLNTREKLTGFYVSPCEFEKEVAGMLNTKDSAFQEALLERGFLKKQKWYKEDRFLPAGKTRQSTSKIRALMTGNAHTKIQDTAGSSTQKYY